MIRARSVVVVVSCLAAGAVLVSPLGAAASSPTASPPTPHSCVHVIAAGESLTIIADALDAQGVTAETLQAENSIADPDVINAGAALDVCVGNGIDDRTGASNDRVAAEQAAASTPVGRQQVRLNELLTPLGFVPLAVDGVSGPKTRQALCAARLLTGLPVNRADMAAGSTEETWILAAPLGPPPTAATDAGRWVLIDQTCQVLVAGEGGALKFVFPTSTGVAEFPTRTVERAHAFRYDPAASNGGWHNSTTYPAAADNPLNGNMYKPIYFSRGQAIHGANTVPPSPASHGCARLRVADQDHLVGWLGLAGVVRPIWERSDLRLVVTIQGDFARG